MDRGIKMMSDVANVNLKQKYSRNLSCPLLFEIFSCKYFQCVKVCVRWRIQIFTHILQNFDVGSIISLNLMSGPEAVFQTTWNGARPIILMSTWNVKTDLQCPTLHFHSHSEAQSCKNNHSSDSRAGFWDELCCTPSLYRTHILNKHTPVFCPRAARSSWRAFLWRKRLDSELH